MRSKYKRKRNNKGAATPTLFIAMELVAIYEFIIISDLIIGRYGEILSMMMAIVYITASCIPRYHRALARARVARMAGYTGNY